MTEGLTVRVARPVRSGARTPCNVACAATANTTRPVSARRFPPPVSTVSRVMQPRASTAPIPKRRPPATSRRTGREAAWNRCASNAIQPAATVACVPISATASACAQTPRAEARSATGPTSARRRQNRVRNASAPKTSPSARPNQTDAARGPISRPRERERVSNMATASARGFDGQHLGREGMAQRSRKERTFRHGQKTGEAIGAYLVSSQDLVRMSRQSRFRTYLQGHRHVGRHGPFHVARTAQRGPTAPGIGPKWLPRRGCRMLPPSPTSRKKTNEADP
jgi:hypothetical protein